jgi:hypothetical protein
MSIVDALPNTHREPCPKPFASDAQGAGNGDPCPYAMKRPSAPPIDRSSL